MNNIDTILQGLQELLEGDLNFINSIVNFIYNNKLLFLIFTVPVVMISVKVLRKLLSL